MPIKHQFVSAIPDGTDATLVRPSNWNANHVVSFIDITYADFVTAIGGSTLLPNEIYRITDFQTDYTIPNGGENFADLYGVTEVLRVTATSTNTYKDLVESESYPTDIIKWTHVNSSGSTKGMISYREDPIYNNKAGYDFRVVVYRRWEENEGVGDYFSVTDTGFAYSDFISFSLSGLGLTSTNVDLSSVSLTDNNIFGVKVYGAGATYVVDLKVATCTNNTINGYIMDCKFGTGFADNIFEDRITGINAATFFYSNRFTEASYQVTCGEYFNTNSVTTIKRSTFGANFAYNTSLSDIDRCTFGNDIHNNYWQYGVTDCQLTSRDFHYNEFYNLFNTNVIAGPRFAFNVMECGMTKNIILGQMSDVYADSGSSFGYNIIFASSDFKNLNIYSTDFSSNIISAVYTEWVNYDCGSFNQNLVMASLTGSEESPVVLGNPYGLCKIFYWDTDALNGGSDAELFNPHAGHDHDGVNSKIVSVYGQDIILIDYITAVPYTLGAVNGELGLIVDGGSPSTITSYNIDGGGA